MFKNYIKIALRNIKKHIGIEIFILSGFLAFVIVLTTVSYQSIKDALANPVDSLRYE